MEDSDFRTLLQKARAGDENAAEDLFASCSNRIRNYLTAIVENPKKHYDEIDEGVNQAFIELLKGRKPLLKFSQFLSFMFVGARSRFLDAVGKLQNRRSPIQLDSLGALEHPTTKSQEGDITNLELVKKLMAELDERTRKIIVLRYWGELTHEEIADVVEPTTGAVKMTLQRAKRRMRELLHSWGIDGIS